MALVHRVAALDEQSYVISFIVPPSVLYDYPPEAYSREFFIGGHKWYASFIRRARHLQVGLTLKPGGLVAGPASSSGTTVASTMMSLRCHADLSFVLLNRAHFTRNEHYRAHVAAFSPDEPTHTCDTFCSVDELLARDFLDERGCFLVDIVMR